jgi:hypothetical protein
MTLTVRGVKAMLTRAGIDYTELGFREGNDRVCITGPQDARSRIWHVLLNKGLGCAPYTDCDWWSRR